MRELYFRSDLMDLERLKDKVAAFLEYVLFILLGKIIDVFTKEINIVETLLMH